MGVWFFTANNEFWSRNVYYPGTRSQTQNPIGAWEGHLSYDFSRRLWASLDRNFWLGGRTIVNGVPNPLTSKRTLALERQWRFQLQNINP
jgi:hypothetical protein